MLAEGGSHLCDLSLVKSEGWLRATWTQDNTGLLFLLPILKGMGNREERRLLMET